MTPGDLCDLQRSKYIFFLLQLSYNSRSTRPIATIFTPFDSVYATSSAVSNPMTLGDVCHDLRRSKGHFPLLQSSYNSGSTGPIAGISTPLDSVYAISSTVSKLVTLDDLCDLQNSKGHFSLGQSSYNSESTNAGPIRTISTPFNSAYAVFTVKAISSNVSSLLVLGDLCYLQILSHRMIALGKSDLLTPERHRGYPVSLASKRLMQSHTLKVTEVM